MIAWDISGDSDSYSVKNLVYVAIGPLMRDSPNTIRGSRIIVSIVSIVNTG